MYGHVITKFSRMGSLPHFFTHGAPLRALRARELSKKSSIRFEKLISSEHLHFFVYVFDNQDPISKLHSSLFSLHGLLMSS